MTYDGIVIPVDANIGTQGVYYLEVIDDDCTAASYTVSATITIGSNQTVVGHGYREEYCDDVEWVDFPPYHGLGDLFRDIEKIRYILAVGRGIPPRKIRWTSRGRSTWY